MSNTTHQVKLPNGATVEVLAPPGSNPGMLNTLAKAKYYRETGEYPDAPSPAQAQEAAPQGSPEQAVIMRRPTDTPQRSQPQAPKPDERLSERAGLGTVRDFVGNQADWGLFGFGDELAGAASVVGNAAGALFGGEGDLKSRIDAASDISGAYQRGKQQFKEDNDRFAEENPGLYATSAALGMIGGAKGTNVGAKGVQSLAQGGGRLAPAAQKVEKVLKPGIVEAGMTSGQRARALTYQGAAMGGLGGIGATDGDIVDVGIGAVKGTALGAGIGQLGSRLMDGGRALSFVPKLLTQRGREKLAQERAFNRLDNLEQNSGLSLSRAADDMEFRQKELGVPSMAADTNNAYRDTGIDAMRGATPRRVNQTMEELNQRQATAPSRMQGAVQRDLGTVVDPERQIEKLRTRRDIATQNAYDALPDTGVPMTKEVVESMQANPGLVEALREGVKRAGRHDMRTMAELGPGEVQKGYLPGKRWVPGQKAQPAVTRTREVDTGLVDANGNPIKRTITEEVSPAVEEMPGRMVPGQVPSVESISNANTYLGQVAKFGDTFAATEAQKGAATAARQTAKELQRLFDPLIPGWAAARQSWRGPKRLEAAFDAGREAAKSGDASSIEAQLRRMSAKEAEYFVRGHIVELNKAIGSTTAYGEATRKVTGDSNKLTALLAVYGKTKGARNLKRFLQTANAEDDAFATFRRASNVRPSVEVNNDSIDAVTTGGRAAAQAGSGLSAAATGSIMKFIKDKSSRFISRRENDILMDALMNQDVKTVRAIVQQMGLSKESQRQLMEKIARRASIGVKIRGQMIGQNEASVADENQFANDDERLRAMGYID